MKPELSFPTGTTLQNGALLEAEQNGAFLEAVQNGVHLDSVQNGALLETVKMAHSLRPYKMAHSLRQYTVFSKVLFSFKMSCDITVPCQCSLCYAHKKYSLSCADFLEIHTCSTIFCTVLLCPYYSSTDSINIDTKSHTQTDRLLPHKARFS
jgi:hypothetical protein